MFPYIIYIKIQHSEAALNLFHGSGLVVGLDYLINFKM